MPISINGSGTLTGISAGGYPDATVTADDLADTLDLSGKTLTLPAGFGGKILQRVQAIKDDTFSTSSTSFADVTDLSASITPSSNSNAILCIASIMVGADNANSDNRLRLLRGTSHTVSNDLLARTGSTSTCVNFVFLRLDFPSTTSSTTYKVQARAEVNTIFINRRGGSTETNGSSALILLEVAPN